MTKSKPKQAKAKPRPKTAPQRNLSNGILAAASNAARASLVQFSAQSGHALSTFLATPSESPLFRMPTTGGPLTSCLRLRSLLTASSGQYAEVSSSSKDFNIILYGQPGRLFEAGPIPMAANTLQYLQNASNGTYAFTASEIYTTTRAVKIGSITPGSSQQWPTRRPIGYSNDETYMLMNTNESLRVAAVAGTVTSHNFQFRVFKWNGINSTKAYAGIAYGTVTTLNAWVTLTLGDGLTAWDGGYYTLECDAAQNGVTYNFCIDSPADLYGYVSVCMPSLMQDTASCVRRTACSLLLSNTTAAMDRGGTLTAQRVDSRPIHLNTSTVKQLIKNKMSPYQGDSGKGLYTYLAFEESDENFITACANVGVDATSYPATNANGDSPTFNLDKPGYVHVVNVVGDTNHVNTFSLIVDTVVEFQCDSQLFSRDTPNHSLSELYSARVITNSTPFFFENPLHLRDIGRFLLNSWRMLQRNSGKIADAASVLYPPGRPAFHALSDLASALPK